MNRKNVETLHLVGMYEDQHLSLRAIGLIVGLSAVGVGKRLKKAGVDTSKGRRIAAVCAFCGADLDLMRCEIKRSRQHYCDKECYFADIENAGGHKPWRQGMRLARAVVSQHFKLLPGHVVHHKDGDNRNNDRVNLAVFINNAEHVSFHRGGDTKPIWDGKDVIL